STTQDREAVRSNLIAHEGEFVSRSSQRAFDTALQGATVAAAALKAPSFLLDYFAWRDQNMAANAVQLQRRRSSNGRVIVWGHQEHLGKTINLQNAKPMGKWLDDQFGHDYFVIGSSAGDGVFNVLDPLNQRLVITAQFPPMSADAYESNFRSAVIPVMLIPLRIELPDWLATPHDLRGGSSNMAINKREDLKQKLDAIIYIDQTTRSNNFW
ncbi:MAG TPA: erythromycin esterase family protein, partial [Thermoanaerobaculia bacterium]